MQQGEASYDATENDIKWWLKFAAAGMVGDTPWQSFYLKKKAGLQTSATGGGCCSGSA